ncbi:MFS general substrate transporter [Macrolepiota fuliginosa MF-IS2]|uniref:MFS general substrate transporter n=1 Tax=Macrolepiota fuliginosa MF-IS2 TaxID=1400762 RepID=A0A9P5X2M7_9AGAR|nr:MFS general substrate transporter [Macrolepiota fuliginosa MF-IS2]
MSSIRSLDKKVPESPVTSKYSSSDIPPHDYGEIVNDITNLSQDQALEEKSRTGNLREETGGTTQSDGKVEQEDEFPDGGWRAWLVVFGGMCNTFSTFGYVNSWGIFQAYYQETLLKDFSPSNIAWIGSIQYALIFLPGLIVGRLFDLGHFRSVFLSSSVILILSTFLIAQCTEYWHFLLCQGIATGIAAGGIFGSSNPIIAHWFKKKRGRALGYMAIGSSLGGTIIPIAAKNLLPRVGFPWTMRIIGFILLVVVGTCNLTMKPRLPPVNIKGGLLNLAAFNDAAFTVYCISSLTTFLGIYTVLTYVNVSATQLGSSPDLAFYFVSFANASSVFGRWAAGLLADKIGPLNVMIPFTFFAGILTYAWPFTRSTSSLVVVTLIYGFCSGTFVSLLSNPIMNFGGEGDAGRRIGMFMTITALGALAGPPISGAINASTGGFEAVGLYAGSAVVVGVLCLLTVRYLVLGRWIGKS